MKLRMRKRVGITARMTVIASLIVRMIVEIRVIARAIMRVCVTVRMRVTVRLQKMKSCTHGFWNTSSRSPVLRRLSSPLM